MMMMCGVMLRDRVNTDTLCDRLGVDRITGVVKGDSGQTALVRSY